MLKKKYQIKINKEWCKSCEICVQMCPSKVFKMEGFYPKIVNADKCTGCMICEKLCPDFAIKVEVKNEKEKI
ncbi:MAG: 4Fe-4S binding protein [Candidatus Marinimicrobia bacterium]|nr:4Fe-4S binding protein [Candidatus Neomarinimicrobiota bacterium]